jgi:hydroxyacylglutathione hydrolase
MKIDRLVLGVYETNCYVLRSNELTEDCLIIDPGMDADELIDYLYEHGLNPPAVILTHGHIDHIAGLAQLRERFPDIKVYIHKLDDQMLSDAGSNLSGISGMSFRTEPADFFLEDNSRIEPAGIKLQVLHTPGHTPGGICLYSADDGLAFVGDTLFAGSVGRTDFPGGSMTQLVDGIKKKLFTLPDRTKIYPGHGPATSIANEKAHNPFLQ